MDKHAIVTKTEAHVRGLLSGEGSGHDWWHIVRVRNLAAAIGEREGADPFVTALGALLHDVADWKFHGGDATVGPRKAREWLEALGADAETIARVEEIVADISFKGAGVATPMRTLEGKCVQDADRLEALGAIGIGRAFAYGGHANRLMYDPDVAPLAHGSFEQYKSAKGTTINHFHEKLLLLRERMQTPTGRAVAESRHAFMEEFLRRFMLEWEARDLALETAPAR